MVQKKKPKYTMELVFGGLVLVILLAIFLPSIFNKSDTEDSRQPDVKREGIDIPIEASDPVLGDKEAPVTFVEFADYQCPTCKKSAEETLAKLKEAYIDKGEVRYVLKDFPLINIHAGAVPAAIAVRAAGEQGKYWEMHDLVFAHQSEWSELSSEEMTKTFVSFAEELKLDIETFEKDMESKELKKMVTDGRRLGDEIGVRYTPTAIVNGKMYEEPIAPNELEEVIENAKKEAGSKE